MRRAVLVAALSAFWLATLDAQFGFPGRVTQASAGNEWTVDNSPADLPSSFVDTDYTIPTCTEIDVGVAPTGACKTITVDSGQNFQTALTDARRGDTIALGCTGAGNGGATFQAPSGAFVAPSKTGTGTVYIHPNANCIGLLPGVGDRVYPDNLSGACDSEAGLPCVSYGADFVRGGGDDTTATSNFDVDAMPTLVGAADYPHQVLLFENGADGYLLMGFTVRPPTGLASASAGVQASLLISTANSDTLDPGTADIGFDRMNIHGDATSGAGRGIVFYGCDRCWVANSYIANFLEMDGDSQGVLACNNSTVIGIYNNYIAASGENIFADLCLTGASVTATMHATDIDIRWNLIQKEVDWVALIGSGLNNYKNLYETKAGCRVLIEGNIFRNNYASNGASAAAQETSVNIKEGDEDTDKYTCHHTIRKNLWQIGIGNWFKFCLAECNGTNTQDGHDLALYNNIAHVDGAAYGRGAGTDGHCIYQFFTTGDDITIGNNTCLNKSGPAVGASGLFDGSTWSCVVINNVWNDGGTPFSSSDFSTACPGGGSYIGNILVGGTLGNYPANQTGFPAAWANVGFVNYNSGNYGGDVTFDAGSTFKGDCTDTLSIGTTDCGANVAVVNNAVSCVLTGLCSDWAPLAPAPRPVPLFASLRRMR